MYPVNNFIANHYTIEIIRRENFSYLSNSWRFDPFIIKNASKFKGKSKPIFWNIF